MTFIIEGIDRSGKSSLCKWLNEKKNFNIYHFDYPKSSDVVQIYIDYLKNNLKFPKNIAFDRAIYSEYVYSRYYGRNSNMTLDKIKMFEDEFKKHSIDNDIAIIYVENDITENLKLLKDEGEGKINSIEDILKLRSLYHEAMKISSIPVYIYNYNIYSDKELFFKNMFNSF